MTTNYDPDPIDDLTDIEICAAIRYLELQAINADERYANDHDKDNVGTICFCLYIALLVCLAFLWFYWQ